jgi:PII-like signaling protein
MNYHEVMMVRIYLTEGEGQLNTLLKRLHDWEKVRGVTVFRGISGYGDSGKIHGTQFIDLSLNLPIVVEFFDAPDKVEQILEHLSTVVKPEHMVKWPAYVNEKE